MEAALFQYPVETVLAVEMVAAMVVGVMQQPLTHHRRAIYDQRCSVGL